MGIGIPFFGSLLLQVQIIRARSQFRIILIHPAIEVLVGLKSAEHQGKTGGLLVFTSKALMKIFKALDNASDNILAAACSRLSA